MSEEPEKLVEGTLISHLLELRDRLIRAIVAVALVFLPCMFYSNQIFTFVATPLREKLPKGTQLIATQVMSPFTTPFKLSLFAAIFLRNAGRSSTRSGRLSRPVCTGTRNALRFRCSYPR